MLTANGGQKALEILAQKERQVDLVITDLVMPAMSGRELVEHIRRFRPIRASSAPAATCGPPEEGERSAYLQKPFTSQELLLKVKQALAASPAKPLQLTDSAVLSINYSVTYANRES